MNNWSRILLETPVGMETLLLPARDTLQNHAMQTFRVEHKWDPLTRDDKVERDFCIFSFGIDQKGLVWRTFF